MELYVETANISKSLLCHYFAISIMNTQLLPKIAFMPSNIAFPHIQSPNSILTFISHFKQTISFRSSFISLYKKNELSDVSSIQIEKHRRGYIQESYKETASMYYDFDSHAKYSPISVQTLCYI